jgi:hypothetical protein
MTASHRQVAVDEERPVPRFAAALNGRPLMYIDSCMVRYQRSATLAGLKRQSDDASKSKVGKVYTRAA